MAVEKLPTNNYTNSWRPSCLFVRQTSYSNLGENLIKVTHLNEIWQLMTLSTKEDGQKPYQIYYKLCVLSWFYDCVTLINFKISYWQAWLRHILHVHLSGDMNNFRQCNAYTFPSSTPVSQFVCNVHCSSNYGHYFVVL